MKVSDLMQAMADAGAPMDAILIAVRAIEEREATVEATRSAARERKRRQRAKERDAEGTVTGQSRDTDVTVPVTVTSKPALSRLPNENNSNPSTHTHPECDTPRPRKASRFPPEFPCPDWADPAVWADLLKNRKAKRLPNTATAHEQFVAAVEGLADPEWPPGRLLKAIVARGWGGAYDPRENRNDRHASQPVQQSSGSRGERRNPVLDMFLQSEAEIRAAEDQEPDFEPGPTLRAIR